MTYIKTKIFTFYIFYNLHKSCQLNLEKIKMTKLIFLQVRNVKITPAHFADFVQFRGKTTLFQEKCIVSV